MLGHRGAPAAAPENTVAAFRRAVELGADGVELDVQLTRDGALVVLHDETVDRTTNGRGLLRDLGFEEVRRLDAGSWFKSSFAGERVPTLTEALAVLPAGALVDVEMKEGSHDRTALVRQTLVCARVEVGRLRPYLSSFDTGLLDLARSEGWKGELGVLAADGDWSWAVRKARDLGARVIVPYESSVENVTPRPDGFLLIPYTVNDPDRASRLVELGCLGLITNHPDIMVRHLSDRV